MPVYARSDLASVAVSAAHGGCGEVHSRPAPGGNPEKIWSISGCSCEDHLRHDPLWSATLSEIPETHDEAKAREDYTKRGANDVNTMLALALARLTGGEIPETVATMISGAMPGMIAAKMVCPDGHENPPGQKFCGECAAPMHQAAAKAALEPPAPPPPVPPAAPVNGNGHAEWAPPKDSQGRKKPMRDWKLDDLHAYAHQLGVDPGGNRAELIDRLRAAKKETVSA